MRGKVSRVCVSIVVLFLAGLTYFCPDLDAQSQCASSGSADLTLSAASGSPVPETVIRHFTFPDDSDLLIRVVDINPFAFKCSVTTSSQAFQETAISSFLGTIGGVANVGASTPNPAPATPAAAPAPAGGVAPSRSFTAHGTPHTVPPNACVDAYIYGVHHEVTALQNQRDLIDYVGGGGVSDGALQTTLRNEQGALQTFSTAVTTLRAQNSCANTVGAARAIANSDVQFAIASVGGEDLGSTIDQLALQGQSLLSRLTAGTDACKTDLASIIDEDSAFLTALVHGSTSLPSAVDRWRAQLSQLNGVNAQLASAKANVATVLQNRQNFSIDTSIHGNQEAVKVTVTCTPVAVVQVPAPSGTSSPAPLPQSPTPSAVTSNSWSRTFSFGAGPRFVLAGGIVVSPLPQITFSTSANPAASGSGSTVPANIIINQQKSSTRVLPIGMLHGRLWDQLPFKAWMSCFPNYLSFGVTAKSSDNKGTNIEYLFGPSWAFAQRQLFLTAGAYAGQQQRLGGSLSVGQATSLSAANLPISQTTVWKVGFAITWAPAGK